MKHWIGKLVTIRRQGDPYFKPQQVRVLAVEHATPFMDSRNPSGVWFWARYA